MSAPIRRQMPEDHDPEYCEMCKFLAQPCKLCGKMHAYYEEAAECMRLDTTAYNQYYKALSRPR